MANNDSKKALNKSDLISEVASRVEFVEEAITREAVRLLIDQMASVLIADERIEVRGFGTFTLKHRNARQSRNPKTGESIVTPAVSIPHFKPSKILHDLLNDDYD